MAAGISRLIFFDSAPGMTTNSNTGLAMLRPYRTFSEVEQPESAFVFRVKADERSGVTMALFEADGSAWKHEAVVRISEYFKRALDGRDVIILA